MCREVEAEYLAEEGEAGPSGTGKKARIVSAEAAMAAAEVAEDEEEAELDDEVEVDEVLLPVLSMCYSSFNFANNLLITILLFLFFVENKSAIKVSRKILDNIIK